MERVRPTDSGRGVPARDGAAGPTQARIAGGLFPMTITYTIPGVPRLNQLNEKENARMDCVFDANAALATAYLGRPFTGTQIKDMDNNYGTGYVGGASEKNLVDTMARLGIQTTAVAHPTQSELVSE